MSRLGFLSEDDEDKAYVRFSYSNCGKTTEINNEYPYDVPWNDILADIVRALEGAYGYSFRIDPDTLGIWCEGKDNDA